MPETQVLPDKFLDLTAATLEGVRHVMYNSFWHDLKVTGVVDEDDFPEVGHN